MEPYDIDYLVTHWSSLPAPVHKPEWVQVYESMIVHTKGLTPTHIIDEKRPYEEDSIRQYRLTAYEPITQPPILKAIEVLERVFHDSEYNVEVSDDLKDYLLLPRYGEGKDFYIFLQEAVITTMIEDPNGLLVWLPSGPGIKNFTETVDVVFELVLSQNILYRDRHSLIYESAERVLIETNKTVSYGKVIYIINEEWVVRIHQVDLKGNFAETWRYKHQVESVPYVVLGGKWNTDGYYDSFFSRYLGYAEEAIRQFSDWQGIMVTSGFPLKILDYLPCNNKQSCLNDEGRCTDINTGATCKTCNGRGIITGFGPYGVLVKPERMDEEEYKGEVLKYVTPPTEIIEYSGNAWKDLLNRAEETLNIRHIEEAQSGVAKIVDREGQYGMLSKFAINMFDNVMYNSMRIIEQYRNFRNYREPIIIKPTHFNIRTSDDIVAELKEIQSIPSLNILKGELIKNYADKTFPGEYGIKKVVWFLSRYDVLYSQTPDERTRTASFLQDGNNLLLKSLYSYSALMEVRDEMGEEAFLDADYKAIEERVNVVIEPLLEEQIQNSPIPD